MSLTAKVLLSPVLVAQALRTRARVPRLPEAAGDRTGIAGAEHAAPNATPLTLLIAGDSSAAGVGVTHQRDALAQPLAMQLAAAVRRTVHWRLVAQSGVTTAGTHRLLIEHAEPVHAEFAVIVTGVNDVVEQVPSHRAVAAREALANWLRNGCGVRHVAFAPLPPVHHFPGLPQPLRWVAGADARRHDRALAEWAATRGDVTHVPLPLPFHDDAMASDGFHPGASGYRLIAQEIALHLAALMDAPRRGARR
ncbi:MAG: SGNH/GDSL hydrolase family protein [Rubrivivax sp.]|nr:SGNH/GDSL hydrolase family protein [Rubrivivax sp.]